MRQRTIPRSLTALMVLVALGAGLSACGGGGGGGTPGTDENKDLYLQKFLVVDAGDNQGNFKSLGGTGSTDVYRDARLLFVFNVPVDPASVSDRTIRIGIPTGGGLFQTAVGRFETVPNHANQIIFNPTFTKGNHGSVADNPLGFEGNATYGVELLSVADATTNVKNLSGRGIVMTFRGQIGTSNEYLPSQNQPEISGHEPADGATGVPALADIRIFFTEPMKPDSFVFGQTFIVVDEASGRMPLGQLRYSTDYRIVTFRPLFGYGKGVNSPDPNLAGVPISVTITRGVTNLAGRQIPVSLQFSFRTEYDPTQPNFDDRREDFSTTTREDRAYGIGGNNPTYGDVYPLATWNATSAPGYLRGVFVSGTTTILLNNGYVTLEPFAVAGVAAQWQTIFYASEVGGSSRTVTGVDWQKYCSSYATTTQATKVMMGHTKNGALTTSFAGNYSDTPVTCVSGVTYNISTGVRVWQALPTYTATFPYNGTDNMILEIQHTGSNGGGYVGATAIRGYAEWLENNAGGSLRSAHTAAQNAPYGTRTANFRYDVRIYYLIDQSEAQSKWYDTGLVSPQFLDSVVLDTTPTGTSSTITYEGAPELPLSGGLPDEANSTDWQSSLSALAGYRFIRFHVEFKGNGTTNQQPEIDEIIFPYIFYN